MGVIRKNSMFAAKELDLGPNSLLLVMQSGKSYGDGTIFRKSASMVQKIQFSTVESSYLICIGTTFRIIELEGTHVYSSMLNYHVN